VLNEIGRTVLKRAFGAWPVRLSPYGHPETEPAFTESLEAHDRPCWHFPLRAKVVHFGREHPGAFWPRLRQCGIDVEEGQSTTGG